MEVKIGVTDSPRELVFNSAQTPDELEKLVTAALGNVLDLGPSALTGPVARGDADAVAAHLAALREWGASAPSTDATIVDSYLAQARRAAAHAAPAPALARVLGEAS